MGYVYRDYYEVKHSFWCFTLGSMGRHTIICSAKSENCYLYIHIHIMEKWQQNDEIE